MCRFFFYCFCFETVILDSVFNKMSRKEKYETNNRRQQTFMSPEDVASGRKSSWQGVEINGESKISVNYKF